MRYVFLVITLIALGTGLYQANKEYKHFDLITGKYEVSKTELNDSWSLMYLGGEKPRFYNFTVANGFWATAKHLWLIVALFALVVALLIPISIIVFKALWNFEIADAKLVKQEARNVIEKAKRDKIAHQEKCDLSVKNAHEFQLDIVKRKLSERLKDVEKREETIGSREMDAFKMKELANKDLSRYRSEFQELKSNFEEKEAQLIMQRDHAIDTMNARRMRFEKKIKKLKQESNRY